MTCYSSIYTQKLEKGIEKLKKLAEIRTQEFSNKITKVVHVILIFSYHFKLALYYVYVDL